MSDLANYMEEAVLNEWLGGATGSSPSATYLAILNDTATASELESGDMTNEITSYTGGNRPQLDTVLNSATQSGGAAQVTTNTNIDYEGMPATTVQWVAVMDSQTADGTGNVLCYAQLGSNVSVSSGATFRIESGDFTFSLD